MRLLLDTHVVIWTLAEPELIPPEILVSISDPQNDVFVSVASVWEIAIKQKLPKRAGAPPVTSQQIVEYLQKTRIRLLPITAQHAIAVADLPLLHADPFDRLLIAQSVTEPLRLVTHDRQVAAYSDTIITW
ncbi:PIN domain-containing protein [uncultured Pleomorphomonas sp.]|uniref:PIN domain-containing protein n=1 Tax=uncultured Pleomorphomonas sp. TaxID=442121 RepID=A0A212LE72_9HYPH|nr:type II toxin-antitoxin system VapC family toxin [uncultured Pleomorphomonas sp.]SCM75659.1 PIN domain-containing protein [uncultured Pleomorphomonas sp.]